MKLYKSLGTAVTTCRGCRTWPLVAVCQVRLASSALIHTHAHTRTHAHAHAHTHTHARTHTHAHARTRTHAHMQSMHACMRVCVYTYMQVYLASSALWARAVCQKCGRPPEGQEWLPANDARSDGDVCIQMRDRIEAHESLNPHGSHKDQVGARDSSVSKMCLLCVSCVCPVCVCAVAEVSLTDRRADACMNAYTHTHTHTHSTCGARRTGRR